MCRFVAAAYLWVYVFAVYVLYAARHEGYEVKRECLCGRLNVFLFLLCSMVVFIFCGFYFF